MIPKLSLTSLPALAALAVLACAIAQAPAATLSFSLTPPVVDGEDIVNLGTPSGTDIFQASSAQNGSSFTVDNRSISTARLAIRSPVADKDTVTLTLPPANPPDSR